MVAGAAISIQGIAMAQLGHRFSPLEMSSILADGDVNTKYSKLSRDRIGVMPNLRGIIRKHFNEGVG